MTKYTKQVEQKVGGKTLTVMIPHGTPRAHIADTAATVLVAAREALDKALEMVNRPHGLEKSEWHLAHRYFLTPKDQPIPDKSLETIRKVIAMTRDGLKGDMVLKTSEKETDSRGEKRVHGRVTWKAGDEYKEAKHSYQSFVKDLTLDDSGRLKRRGAIHVESTRLRSKWGMKSLIHEATHKYAGTIDYRYFEDNGVTAEPPLKDPARALINADSYAWFVTMLDGQSDAGRHLPVGLDLPPGWST
ncbi:MAG: hypothetical protein JO339_28915 [Alphaproteobacteria bacterium]|nr:hypothetical protein [Alphaproteobacteria bacterium]